MNALASTLRVIWALAVREAITRNGRLKFGYVLALIEPALYILILLLFRIFLGSSAPFGENFVVFFITAMITIRTALALTRRTAGAINANLALLTYPVVKTFDTIAARVFVEAGTWTLTTVLFIVGLYAFSGIWLPVSLDTFLAGYGATVYLGACFGVFNATFVRIFPFWEKILAFLSLPIVMLSGVFFLPSALPPPVLDILWFNPFMHVVEWVRAGVYLDYRPFLSVQYVLSFSTVLLFLGLLFNRFYQHRLLER